MEQTAQEVREPTATEWDGVYYFFDCMNAFITDRYFVAGAFENEAEAKRTAANYEAELYRCIFRNGEMIERECIYNPYSCFDN